MSALQIFANRIFTIPRVTLVGILHALVSADARYRDGRHIDRLPAHLLHDVGLRRGRTGQVTRR